MKIRKRLPILVAAVALLAGVSAPARAQPQNDAAAVPIGAKDIGGVVSSPQGREAGVWVIAETTELPTQFRRIVVTDDQGRYLVPDPDFCRDARRRRASPDHPPGARLAHRKVLENEIKETQTGKGEHQKMDNSWIGLAKETDRG